MARPAIRFSDLTHDPMNSGKGYRVQLSYGAFTVAPRLKPSGIYYYAYKRVRGKLHKRYVGRCGRVTRVMLHQATMALTARYDIGQSRDNASVAAKVTP